MELSNENHFMIDWSRVATLYDGIYFDNYITIKNQINFSEKCWWYYGIDVSSGCIFNVKSIKFI